MLEVIAKNLIAPFAQKLLKLIEGENYTDAVLWSLLAGGIIFLLGFAITWIGIWIKNYFEIGKTKAEIKDTKLKQIEKIQNARNKYVEESNLYQIAIEDLTKSLESKKSEGFGDLWDQSRDLFFNQLLTSFSNYVEYCEVMYEDQHKKRIVFISDEIMPFLETVKEFLDTMNHTVILRIANRPKIILYPTTVSAGVNYMDTNISFYYIRLKSKAKRIKKDLFAI